MRVSCWNIFPSVLPPIWKRNGLKKKIILATDYLDSVRDYVMSSHGKHGRDEPDPVTGGFMVMVEKRMP